MSNAEVASKFAVLAQRWHETDHGPERGKKLRKSKFILPRDDDFDPADVPEAFRECKLCNPAVGWQARNNPYWFRVVAWESGSE